MLENGVKSRFRIPLTEPVETPHRTDWKSEFSQNGVDTPFPWDIRIERILPCYPLLTGLTAIMNKLFLKQENPEIWWYILKCGTNSRFLTLYRALRGPLSAFSPTLSVTGPYSVYSQEEQILLKKESNDGFFSHATKFTPNTIFYNDSIPSHEKQRYTIFHEVKHFVNGDNSDKKYDDDMAEFFSRYFMAPIPYLVKMDINDIFTLISDHEMSLTAAENALKNVRNRKAKYGNHIFEHEKPLIELLCPDL